MEELTAIKTADGREFKPWASKETVQEVVQQAVQDPASITAIASDIASGKSELSASISAKGVPSTTLDSFSSMATKIRQIPQTVNTGLSDFDQMVAPNPYIWNVYTVAEDLMKNELPDYIPTYMSGYKSRYGANSFFVGEYYRGYDSLELTGADGYLTHDGDFYTIADGTVTHTLPDGTVETYSDTTIIHTWHDTEMTQCNRWVAFFYLNDAYSFTNITSSICPRRVALCGTCDSFIVSGENRLTDLWVIGTLGHFEGGTTGDSWNPAQVIRNYKEHSFGTFFQIRNNTIRSCIFADLETIVGGNLLQNYADSSTSLSTVSAPNLKVFSGGTIISVSYLQELVYVYIGLTELNGGRVIDRRSDASLNINNNLVIYAPFLKIWRSGYLYKTAYTSVSGYNAGIKSYITDLEELYIGVDTIPAGAKSMVDFTVGKMTTNLDCRYWNPTNVLADPDKTATLIDNIKNHILARVSDATGGTQLVFKVSTNMYNAIANENIEWQGETMSLADAFLTKNWLFAGA